MNKEEFVKELVGDGVVLVDFWATWCGPCKMLKPIIEEIGAEGHKVVMVDIDVQPQLVQDFNIMSVPTLVVFKDGEVYHQVSGFKPKEVILDLLEVD